MVKGYTYNGQTSITISAESCPDRRLIDRLVSAIVDEINFRASEGDWDLRGLLEVGSALLELKEEAEKNARAKAQAPAADQEADNETV